MKQKILFILLFFFAFVSIASAAYVPNYSFEDQGTTDTNAALWEQFDGNNWIFQQYNPNTGVCFNKSIFTLSTSSSTYRCKAPAGGGEPTCATEAKNGNYVLKTAGATVIAIQNTDLYLGTLTQDQNFCFWIKGWIVGQTGLNLGIIKNTGSNINYCRVVSIGGISIDWHYRCGNFPAGTYNGYFTLEAENDGYSMYWDAITSGGLNLFNFSPKKTYNNIPTTFKAKVFDTNTLAYTPSANVKIHFSPFGGFPEQTATMVKNEF